MGLLWFILVVLLQLCFVFGQGGLYDVKYIEVPIDHFSFVRNDTFKLRYLVNDSNWEDGGPILFYTGNEGDIISFAENTGFMFEIAPHFNALVIFAEHRYYGVSQPFGNLSYDSPQHLGYLSSTQALADYVYLIDYLKKKQKSERVLQSPVVAFGGSYGGMLAAWLRMKYPASVVGSIAASAPVVQFDVSCDSFNRILTSVYKYSVNGFDCSNVIRKSWPTIRNMFKQNKTELTVQFKLCKDLTSPDDLIDWLGEMYGLMGMANYPYSNSFLAPLPPYPVRAFCTKLSAASKVNDTQLLKILGESIQVYTNYTGKTKCNDLNGSGDNGLGMQGWDFQACNEIIMPMCSKDSDMFENVPWDFKKFADDCATKFKIRPQRQDLAVLEYGGKHLKTASNIVFSNGLLDPWSGGGVLYNVSNTVSAVIIPEGAHHLDLRSSNPADPQSVIEARKFHVNSISRWLRDYYYSNNVYYNPEEPTVQVIE